MAPVVIRLVTISGISFIVFSVFEHFVPDPSWPAYLGMGVIVGVVSGLLNPKAKDNSEQGL